MKYKVEFIAGIAVVGIAAAAVVFGGQSGLANVTGNAKVDQSKDVKSNVGDNAMAEGAIQIGGGVSAGGDIGQIGNNANTITKTSEAKTETVNESEETYEGNE